MIKKETHILVADNSGAKFVRCIGFYGNKTYAEIGDIIMVSVQSNYPKANIRRRTLQRALVIRTKYPFKRDNITIKFNDNAVIIVDKKNQPVSNKIFGATVREIKSVSNTIMNIIETIY